MFYICQKDFEPKKYSYLFFDLDGTLTQSGIGITRAGAYALRQFGIEKKPEELTHLIGPPLEQEFVKSYGFSPADAQEAVRQFRVYYLDRGWKENAPYDGIVQALKALKDSGKHLAVVTSKPEVTARKILSYFGLSDFFDLICGPQIDGPDSKDFLIREAFRRLALPDTYEAVMIGDRSHDVIGAHLAGIPAVGVLYGYGSREELAAENPEGLVETVSDLVSIFT